MQFSVSDLKSREEVLLKHNSINFRESDDVSSGEEYFLRHLDNQHFQLLQNTIDLDFRIHGGDPGNQPRGR